MNAVRVHAHVAEKAFYEACDELGLLVFQDFPLQWTHRRSVLEPAVAQAREMARDLRSHPCVGIYLAHDEPFYVVPPREVEHAQPFAHRCRGALATLGAVAAAGP